MSRQRRQPPRQRRDTPLSPASRGRVRRLTRNLALAFGLALLAGAGWFAASSRNSRDHTPGHLPGPRTSVPGVLPARGGAPAANNDQDFGTRVNHGNQLLSEGKAAEALAVLTEAMKLHPEDDDVHYDLGLVLTRLGRLDEAIQQYTEALRLFPDYVEAHNNLGNLLLRTGQTQEAIQHFETAVKIMPDYASAHNNLGTALQRADRTNDALLHFQQAVKFNPDYWEARFNVATCWLQAGRLTEARSELETVLRLRPDFGPAKAALAEVQARQIASGRH